MATGKFVFPPRKYIDAYPVDLNSKTGLRTGQGSIAPLPPSIYRSNRLSYTGFAQGINTASNFTIKSISVTGSYFGTTA